MNTCAKLFERPLRLRHCQIRWLKTAKETKQYTPAEYCLELVRRNDYENFMCTLLLPSHLTSTAFAIRAYNTEIALVEDQVSEDKIGLMRLKFWEEALNDTFNDKPPQNPTCLELNRILKQKKLSKIYFKRLHEARVNKLKNSTFRDIESMEKYAENTVSSIFYLLLEASGIKDMNTDHFASHLGKAHGIVTLIRSIPHNAQKRKMVIPQSTLLKHNVSQESVLRGKSSTELEDVIFEIACTAKVHLEKALAFEDYIKKESKLIFLPIVIVEDYLERLRKADFDIFEPNLHTRNVKLPFQLYWKKLFG